ncbi:MAG: NAD(P)H-hydrate dehydratase [Lacunisphaera sp.]|nr:NAD(P)H-hydrate dehydratase [Lacunisphaera sp.]
MHLIPSHPILTCPEAKAWEAGLLKDETTEWAAMQRAGAAIAAAIEEDFKEIGGLPDDARILVLMGRGHNGGDALLAAQALLLAKPAATAEVLLCSGEAALRPLAQKAFAGLMQSVGQRACSRRIDTEGASKLAGLQERTFDLCIDGVFGFQFRPPLQEHTAKVLAWVNTHPRIRFRAAVDLPSGMGDQNAGTVYRADFTYATGIVKSPVVAENNAVYTGRLRYLDLGFFKVERVVPDALGRVLLPSLLAPLAQLRRAQTDKRTYGHLFLVGGSLNYPGAVLMSVQAALRSGVGLLTAFVPASLVPEYAAKFPEAMWVGWPETSTGGLAAGGGGFLLDKLPRATALAIGPGLGAEAETLAAVQEIVRAATVPLLLDADALRPEVLAAVGNKPFIATPHAGEYQRIVSALTEAMQGVLVLKGPLTRIVGRALRPTESGDVGHKARPTYYSPFGGPVLARGGSGDLLTGLTGGLLAQTPDDLLLAAGRGVVWHGLAADLLARDKGQVAVQTTQLFDYLQPALLHAAHESF